ncbi:hypothetical protein [Nocardia sp. NPDC047648]|uniref:hypothetical protein n=1 Tax=Nocardia sp. NPDC047648 TaxID=3155625 RepID=UPI0034072F42
MGDRIIWDFVVPGTPRSLQAKGPGKAKWKQKVRECATNGLHSSMFPCLDTVSVSVVFFHLTETLDMDNMLKPILDGIYPEVILDDAMIQDLSGSRRDISEEIAFKNPPECIIEPLGMGEPFVYVAIAVAMDKRELPWI